MPSASVIRHASFRSYFRVRRGFLLVASRRESVERFLLASGNAVPHEVGIIIGVKASRVVNPLERVNLFLAEEQKVAGFAVRIKSILKAGFIISTASRLLAISSL